MDDFVGNKKLIAPERLRELNQRTNLRGALQVGSHLGAVALSTYGLVITWGSYWMIPLFVIQGVLINFLYAGQHELSHWTVFNTKRLNNVFGHLIGFLMLMARERDRMVHYQHHRFTQDPELDGELDGAPPFTLVSYTLYFLAITYWLDLIYRMFCSAVDRGLPKFFTQKQRRIATIEARFYLLGYGLIALASWYFQSWAAVALWLAPMFATKFIHQCQNITEHTGMPNEADILTNTRSISSNPLLDWLAWNMPYHTAHHTYPAVPFFRLPQLHKEMVDAMGYEPETIGYLSFQIHMFRKLWKEGTSQYTGKPIRSY